MASSVKIESPPSPVEKSSLTTPVSGASTSTEVEKTPSDPNSCSKDIDLKAIESEMRGLDRPVKKEEEISMSITPTPHAYDGPRLQRLNLEKKQQENSSAAAKKTAETTPTKATDSSSRSESVKKEDCFEDDIYEFKEPEPFEIGEMRSRKDGRNSKGGMGSPQEAEEQDGTWANKRKKGKKEGDTTDASGSDSDSSPCKKMHWDTEQKEDKKETPVKKDFKPSPVKREGSFELESLSSSKKDPDTPKTEIMNEQNSDSNTLVNANSEDVTSSLSSSVLSIGGLKMAVGPNAVCPIAKVIPKKETVLPKPLHAISATDIKVVKLDISASGSPLSKLSQGEVVGKVTSIARPKMDIGAPLSQAKPVASCHIMAQVMAPKPAKAIIKALPKDVSSKSQFPEPSNPQQLSSSTSSIVQPPLPPSNITVPTSQVSNKLEDKGDSKIVPFIKRQQHIFPHLLNRPAGAESPTPGDQKKLPPVESPALKTVNKTKPNSTIDLANPSEKEEVSNDPGQELKTETDKTSKGILSSTSSVGESIESVIQKARQKPNNSEGDSSPDKSLPRSTPEKRKKPSSKGKNDDNSDLDNKSKNDNEWRHKKVKLSDSPNDVKLKRDSVGKRQYGKRKDDSDKSLDEDRDDLASDDEDCKFSPVQAFKKQRLHCFAKKVESSGPDTEEDSIKGETEDGETDTSEVGLGELLCEETIPPGSPMTQETGEAEISVEGQYGPTVMPPSPFAKRHPVHSELDSLITASPLLVHNNNQLHSHSFMRHHHVSGGQVSPQYSSGGPQSMVLGSNRWATMDAVDHQVANQTLFASQSNSLQFPNSNAKSLLSSSPLVSEREESFIDNSGPGILTSLADDENGTQAAGPQGKVKTSAAGDANNGGTSSNNNEGAKGGGSSSGPSKQEMGGREGANRGGAPIDSVPPHVLENSLPTTPESLSSNLTDSPTRCVLQCGACCSLYIE